MLVLLLWAAIGVFLEPGSKKVGWAGSVCVWHTSRSVASSSTSYKPSVHGAQRRCDHSHSRLVTSTPDSHEGGPAISSSPDALLKPRPKGMPGSSHDLSSTAMLWWVATMRRIHHLPSTMDIAQWAVPLQTQHHRLGQTNSLHQQAPARRLNALWESHR